MPLSWRVMLHGLLPQSLGRPSGDVCEWMGGIRYAGWEHFCLKKKTFNCLPFLGGLFGEYSITHLI